MQLPFHFVPVNQETRHQFYDGRIISTFDLCGIFLCSRGEIEILFGDRTYLLHRGDMYIYVPSTLVRLLHKSNDAEGMMLEAELNYILPIVSGPLSVENLLYLRQHPCISLTEPQYRHIWQLTETLYLRIHDDEIGELTVQHRNLMLDIYKSMGQTLCYEVMNVYFSNRPLQPLPQGKKDVVFHNFMMALFRHYTHERDVAFYAQMQHLDPRYFSTIIKEKSGNTPLHWIVQMVITEARQLLESSDLSIKEISARLNFSNQSFFGKYFKQYVGISPKEYRLRQQNEV